MKRNKAFIILLVIFILSGIFITQTAYYLSKQKIVENNNHIVSSLLNSHPELESEIINILKNPNETSQILEKYGLENLESLEYLEDMKTYHLKFITLLGVYIFSFTLVFALYFYVLKKKRTSEIKKVDKYLFSLLSTEIKVDLKDFENGELKSLQNDLMKVTSRLKNALEASSQSKKELSKNLADISHQLKTPLTSLSIINEALSTSNITEETKQEFLKKQTEVIEHMQTLIISLLKVSQIESGSIILKKDKIKMKELIHSTLSSLDTLRMSKNVEVSVKQNDDIFIIGDAEWLKEALGNIIKNGIEHSKENGFIEIKWQDTPIYVELTIKDYGTGIEKKDLPHIFERFYKSSSSKDSIGIGLNLAESILDKTFANIKVQSKVNEFTEFTIHFYKTNV